MNSPIFPHPELILPQKIWDKRQGNGSVNSSRGVITTPFDSSAFSRFVRTHEIYHVRFSPRNPETAISKSMLPPDLVQFCEDARMGFLMREHCHDRKMFCDSGLAEISIGAINALAKVHEKNPLMLAATCMAGFPFDWRPLDVSDDVFEVVYNAARLLSRNRKSFKKGTLAAARYLLLHLAALDKENDSLADQALAAIQKNGKGRDLRWGDMEIIAPPRPVFAKSILQQRRYLASAEGLLRRSHRLLTDGKCFSVRKRLPGGSLLIDASGSMSISMEDISAILEKRPAAVIACYRGTAKEGYLVILAKDGKRVSSMECIPYCTGNIVDGPALRWLSKQPAPRFWISDGQVTGIGDVGFSEGKIECALLCRKYRIRRVINFDFLPSK